MTKQIQKELKSFYPRISTEKSQIPRPTPSKVPLNPISSNMESHRLLKAMSYYLTQYLSSTQAGGYFIALSGGVDSTLTALSVFSVCQSLSHYLYSSCNGEILSLLSYILAEGLELRKVPTETEGTSWFTGKQLKDRKLDIAMGSKTLEDVKDFEYYGYFTVNTGELVSDIMLASRILNVGYLPMKFSKVTRPFYESLVKVMGCRSMIFPIQNIFDVFKKQGELLLEK